MEKYNYSQDTLSFRWIDENIKKFLQTIDFSLIKEINYHPNNTIQLIRSIQWEADYILGWKNNKILLISLIEELKEFVEWYFIQIYLRTKSFVSVCDGHDRIISNLSLKEFTGKEENQIWTTYAWKEKESVLSSVNQILNGSLVWYNKIFLLRWEKVAWTTVKVPFTQINIRFWFPIWKNEWYKNFYQEWLFKGVIFGENDLFFTKKALNEYQEKYLVKIRKKNLRNYLI